MPVLAWLAGRIRMFVLGLLLPVLGASAWAADGPASTVFFGFNASTVNVYAEIADRRAIVVLSCAGSTATQFQVNEAFSESWSIRIRGNGASLSRSQLRIFGAPGKGGNNCDFPDPGGYAPVASREEAVRQSGVDIASVDAYQTYHAQVFGQRLVLAPGLIKQGAPDQAAARAEEERRLREMLARIVGGSVDPEARYFGFRFGTASVFAEIANGKAIMVSRCEQVTNPLVNATFSGSWNEQLLRRSVHLSRTQFRIFGINRTDPCLGNTEVSGGVYPPSASREEAVLKSGIEIEAIPEYRSYYAQAYGRRIAAAPTIQAPVASAGAAQTTMAQAAGPQPGASRLEEERRQREASLKVEEERRLKDALAKAEQDRVQREAQLKAETDRRIAEALAKADEERRQREALAKVEEERRLKEALAKADEERRQKEALARAEEERRIKEALARAEDERRKKDALARADEERRQKALQARAEEDRRQREQLAKSEEARRQKEAAEDAAEDAARRATLANNARRKALVFGNDTYRDVPELRNARSDARAMSAALLDLGYAVRMHLDLGEREMKKAIRDFITNVSGGDEVLFFFAGHGVQIGAANYLLPVDVRADDAASVRDEGIPLQRVLDDLNDAKARLTVAIIDACRDNPFKGTGRAIGGRGLAPTSTVAGQMVMFSAGAGQQALDSVGPNDKSPNGLFTRTFLKHLSRKGVTVDRIMRDVRAEVNSIAKTVGHDQVPALYDQVVGDFYFSQ